MSCPKQCYTWVVSGDRTWYCQSALAGSEDGSRNPTGHRLHAWQAHRRTAALPRSWVQAAARSLSVCVPRGLRLGISPYLGSPVLSYWWQRWRLLTSLQCTVPMPGWHTDEPLLCPGPGCRQQPAARWSVSPEVLDSGYLSTQGHLSCPTGDKDGSCRPFRRGQRW